MIFDMFLLARLRGVLLLRGLRVALSFLGYDTEDTSVVQRLYGVYVLVFMTLWFVLVGSWSLFTAARVGEALSAGGKASGLAGLPWVLVGLFFITLLVALRTVPLKLSLGDIAYVAATPLSRPAITLDALLRLLLLMLPVFGWLMVLAGVVFAPPGESSQLEAHGWRLGAVALPWATLAVALAWIAGIGRLRLPVGQRLLLWLLPVALAGLAVLPGQPVLWPAQVLVSAYTALSPAALLLPIVLAVAAIGGLIWISNGLNLIDVVDESQGYAQLRAVGLYALINPALVQRAISQPGRRGAARLGGRMAHWQGVGALLARSLLSFRRRPFGLLTSLVWGAALLPIGAQLLTTRPAIQVLATWMFATLLVAPRGQVQVFRADVDGPFLSQFLFFDRFTLLVADAAPAWLLLLGAGLVSAVVQGLSGETLVAQLALIPLLSVIVLLCQALALVPISQRGRRVPYAVLIAGSLGMLCVLSRFTDSAFTLIIAALFLAALLGRWLQSTH